MSDEEFVADDAGDEVRRQILLLERHMMQTSGKVPQGKTPKRTASKSKDSRNVRMSDKLTHIGSK